MIYSYGVTQQGAYHIKNNTPCQDAHAFKRISGRFAVGAVADGLGSELYSDIASKIAAEKSLEYCCEHITEASEADAILTAIKESFAFALQAIENKAAENGHALDQYDTTLVVAVYLNGNIYFGNSGDSGIVVLNANGTYESITEQQRDENGCVFPLCFGEKYWAFGTKENIASVFLATDGMYETLFPYLLQGEDVNIYVALAEYMMSPESLGFTKDNEKEVAERMSGFIGGIPGEQVSDDKTVLVMVDDAICTERQPDEYYQTPDWVSLKQKRDEEYKRCAYPHLYQD